MIRFNKIANLSKYIKVRRKPALSFLVLISIILGLITIANREELQNQLITTRGYVIYNNNHNATLAIQNKAKIAAIKQVFPSLFSHNSTLAINLSNTPQAIGQSWAEGEYTSFTIQTGDKTVNVDFYLNVDLIKKYNWNEKAAANELEFQLFQALYYLEDKQDHVLTNLSVEQAIARISEQEEYAMQKYSEIKSVHPEPLFIITYEN